jgi:NADH:ubiquinone oxidoreductase subunit 6 (subunit J)
MVFCGGPRDRRFAMVRTVWVAEADRLFALGLGVLAIVFGLGIVSRRRSVHAGVLVFWLLFQLFAVSQRFTAG